MEWFCILIVIVFILIYIGVKIYKIIRLKRLFLMYVNLKKIKYGNLNKKGLVKK